MGAAAWRVRHNQGQHQGKTRGMSPAATPVRSSTWHIRAVESLKVADPALLRGVPVNKVLHSFSNVLRNNAANPKHYAMSECVEKIDTFMSHTWSTPGYQKFLVLVFHYNITAALAMTVVVAGVTCCLTAHGLLPSVMVVGVATEQHLQFHRGLLCLPLGVLTFFASLFALHELDRCCIPCRQDKMFLDVSCVHQTDMDLKRKGIESLAAFLDRSKEILVLYSDNYLQRLWTIYEVASWLVLRRGERMTVRPIFAPGPLLGGCLAFTVFQGVWFVMSVLGAKHFRTFEMMAPYLGLSLSAAAAMPVYTVAAWLSGIWAASLEMMETHVARFRLADAQCFCEADRSLVHENISAFMKFARLVDPGASREQVCEAFEALVHREVPSLIRASLGRVGIPYSWVVVLPLPYLLVALDWASGWGIDGRSTYYVIWWSVLYLMLVFTVFPLVVAMMFTLAKHPALRRCLGYLSMAVLSFILSFGLLEVFSFLTQRGETDKKWLCLLLPIYTLLVVATVMIYRPLRVVVLPEEDMI